MLKFFPPPQKRKGMRGYLGPIGDDIPSLIPIIVGLITFFGAFTYTLNEYNQRSQSFAADRDSLVIANALKGDSYLSSAKEFAAGCKGLRVRGLDYLAVVVDSTQWKKIAEQATNNSTNKLSLIVDHIYPLENDPLICSAGLPEPVTQSDLANIIDNRQFIVLSFPVAVESPLAVVPATLVVITWRV